MLVASLLESHSDSDEEWLDAVSASADPDLALTALQALDVKHPDALRAVWAQAAWLHRLVAVLGASHALGHHLMAHPEALDVLAPEPQRLDAGELRARMLDQLTDSQLAGLTTEELAQAAVTDPAAADRLRLANRRELLRIAARDLTSPDPQAVVDDIAAELADLADVVVMCALMLARGEVPNHQQARLAVVALGKCGAQELNYSSDVDVLYVGEPADETVSNDQALRVANRIAAATARICSAHTRAGSIWPLDAALRPEGNQGPLVRTLASHRVYYDKWAESWEFQAMMKARPMAGDLALGQGFCDLVGPLVWQVSEQESFLGKCQVMRGRVVSLIPAEMREREIKLGAGGLRDVEFSVQLLQLVHGRADQRLRLRSTLPGLQALVDHGYIGRADGAELQQAYRFERCLEHRAQLFHLRRTHLMPDQPGDLRRTARSLGVANGDELFARWRATARRVERLHRRVFYSPVLGAVSRLSTDELRLTPEAAQTRMRALGFSDPAAALRHIQSLTQGVSRTVEIQRQLMPAMLGWIADGPNPDLGLLNFRQLSDALGTTSWYMRALRDEGLTAERLARLLSSSRYVFDLLKRDPSGVQLLGDDSELHPRSRDDLSVSMAQALDRHDDQDEAIWAVRAIRRHELFRLAAGNLVGTIDLDELGIGLTDLAAASIDAALRLAARDVGDPPAIGVISMGRWGGCEMGYGSDADAMFVIEDGLDEEAVARATRIVSKARELLRRPGPEPALEVDADLRPDGRTGPLVRTLSSYLTYYQRWADTWEAQALLRAGRGACDLALVGRFLDGIASCRWPPAGITDQQVAQIRRLKLRMGAERARGSGINLKLGPGGLSDVEWSVQLLQLQHGGRLPGLRTTRTMAGVDAALEADLMSGREATALRTAWQLASRIRNAVMLVRGRGADSLPTDVRDIAAVAMLLGYGRGEASTLVEDWSRAARHAAHVVDRVFWGHDPAGQP